ncbi:hypothetical protein BDA99DRAFT_542455 [Phascolomyces articulosus]|uniref:Uncharacterized protein n=1 Tax=Phascolomyces articulosus TaxID=60185 RepID=A0AAD5K0Y7_9FUNG|nr:hypothetical protein BDA99DRAFT_542455 [Phascolomyces articulosus]
MIQYQPNDTSGNIRKGTIFLSMYGHQTQAIDAYEAGHAYLEDGKNAPSPDQILASRLFNGKTDAVTKNGIKMIFFIKTSRLMCLWYHRGWKSVKRLYVWSCQESCTKNHFIVSPSTLSILPLVMKNRETSKRLYANEEEYEAFYSEYLHGPLQRLKTLTSWLYPGI